MSVLSNNNVHTVMVIGLGLIGGSIAKAVKLSGQVDQVIGFDADPQSMDMAVSSGVVDAAMEVFEQGVAQADLVLIAVPTLAVESVFEPLTLSALVRPPTPTMPRQRQPPLSTYCLQA